MAGQQGRCFRETAEASEGYRRRGGVLKEIRPLSLFSVLLAIGLHQRQSVLNAVKAAKHDCNVIV